MPKSFAATARDHQLQWALSGHIRRECLQQRNGEVSWVLKSDHRKLNLFEGEWWKYIAGKEHRWAGALNSSQCFGVNLFAPLAQRPSRARHVLQQLLPDLAIGQSDLVTVSFEHTPEGAPGWLGESNQPTQVDVFFEIARAEQRVGYVLVEVKYSETGFGECRGRNGKRKKVWTNPGRNRCQSAAEVVKSPDTQCWLAQSQGRHYWKMLSQNSSSFEIDQIARAGACPFRHGLYQMMRNRLLGDELSRQAPGTWSAFAVCHHPANRVLSTLAEPVAGTTNAFSAFRAISSPSAVRDWNAEEVLGFVGESDSSLLTWRRWIQDRYFPSDVRS